jgi:hypothetical protein
MNRVFTLLSAANHRVTLVSPHPPSAGVSAIPAIHPSDALLLAILIVVGCAMLVIRMVNFVLGSLVSQLVQIAVAVMARVLILTIVIAVLIAIVLTHR